MKNNNIFNAVGALKTPMSAFNLSYEKKYTADMGQLIPVLCDEAVPGDIWEIGNSAITRFQPLVAPVMHQLKHKTWYFFCPYRLLDDTFEEFITRGEDGDQVIVPPTWNPTTSAAAQANKLWDYLGFPTESGIDLTGMLPLDYPRRAYNTVWNQYFRDEVLQAEVALTNEEILYKCWDKDYFSSSLPFLQKGTEAILPVTGNVDFTGFTVAQQTGYTGNPALFPLGFVPGANPDGLTATQYSGGSLIADPTNTAAAVAGFSSVMEDSLNANNTISAQSVSINDLRLAWQIQTWMERNARAGSRYISFIASRFPASPRDDRLQRMEFLGSTSSDIMFSEVLQTSSTASEPTPQGNMAGRGIALQSGSIGKYRVEEYGLIIGLTCVYPNAVYQQGINRQWLRRTTFDMYFPELANIGEQEVLGGELIVSDDPVYNQGIWGYTGRYNEMRYKPNMVVGEMKNTFDYWHLGRIFDKTAPPTLDSDFLKCDPDKRIFAVQNVPGLICTFGNHLNVLRPMPFMSEPYALGV